MKLVHCKWTG